MPIFLHYQRMSKNYLPFFYLLKKPIKGLSIQSFDLGLCNTIYSTIYKTSSFNLFLHDLQGVYGQTQFQVSVYNSLNTTPKVLTSALYSLQ